jgi:predicted ATPase/DNA-binding SARP family transcriptional activator
MANDVRIGVLGSLVVAGGDAPVARQQRLLLLALAAAAPREQTADRLIEGLWADNPPLDVTKALQVLVTRLRKALEKSGIGIVLEPDGYRLDMETAQIDAVQFRRLCGEERSVAATDLIARRRHLERALRLFRGEPFGDMRDEPLVSHAATEISLMRDDIVGRFHEIRLSLGEAGGLLPELMSWAQAHPIDEAAWCRLAVGLAQAGRRPEALRALRRYRQVVGETTGLEPTSAVTDLEADLIAAAPAEPKGSRMGNLPALTRSVLGRSNDLARLAEQLGPNGIVTVVGVGGIGKTTLAIEVARMRRDGYPDGVWLCELGDIESGSGVVDLVADTLAVSQQRGRTRSESLLAAFADATALVIVDNCEHVLSSAAELVAALRKGCPGVTVLATSRQPLDLGEEVVTVVEPLGVPVAGDQESTSPAFQLFVERARENGAVLRLDDQATEAVSKICRQLDGLPLAIELAAARCRSMSLVELSERLDQRFDLLKSTNVDRHQRQQTLWSTIDWSHQLLTPAEQRRFAHLSVFLGGFTVAGAAAVTADDEAGVEEELWSLANQSLVTMALDGDITRYEMLESLRQFGHQQLLSLEPSGSARDAHLRHFVSLAEETNAHIRGPAEGRQVQRINLELANLRAAHQHAVATTDRDAAERLVAALHDYAEWRQFFELGSWAQSTLALPGNAPSTASSDPTSPEASAHLPVVHATAGWGCCISGAFEAAIDHASRGLNSEATGGDTCGWLHDVLAHAAFFQGHAEEGLQHGDTEILRARAGTDPYRLGYVLADNSIHAGLDGNAEMALERAEESLQLATTTGNPSLLSMAYLAHGFARREADPLLAIDYLRRAATLAESVESTWTTSIARGELAVLLALHGNTTEAIELVGDLFQGFRRAGDEARARGLSAWRFPRCTAFSMRTDGMNSSRWMRAPRIAHTSKKPSSISRSRLAQPRSATQTYAVVQLNWAPHSMTAPCSRLPRKSCGQPKSSLPEGSPRPKTLQRTKITTQGAR